MRRVLRSFLLCLAVSLAAWAQTTPVISGVSNSVSGQTTLAPGLLASIYGTGLAPLSGNTTVTLGDVACDVTFVSSTQVNVQLPTNAATGMADIFVTHDGVTSGGFSVTVAAASPAIDIVSGLGLFVDNSTIVTTSAPAKAGDMIVGYGVGFGATNPVIATGTPAPTNMLVHTAATMTVTVDGQPATVSFAGLQPGYIGGYQINFTIPSDLVGGAYPVVATVDSISSPPVVLVVGLPTTTTLNSTGTPAQYGQSVTLMATVSPSAATGNVTFFDGVTILGVAPLSSGVATLATTLLASGARSLTAFYNGSGSYMPSRSSIFTQTMTPVVGGSFINPPGNPFGAETSPQSLEVGDFNGDGVPDLAIANYISNNVTILTGNGSGGFSQPMGSPISVGHNPSSIVAGDFDGNGTTDLAVANHTDSTVSLLLGSGNGQFVAQGGTPPSTGTRPQTIVTADFNGDGIPDLATSNGGTNNVTVLLGAGDGTFTPMTGPTVTGAYALAVGDFNGDSIADLAVAASGNVTTLIGNGDGTFTPAMAGPTTVPFPGPMAVGDFNGDGKADLAVIDIEGPEITILLGDGHGGFSQATGSPIALDGLPSGVAIGDFNADGNQDLVITAGSDQVVVLLGTGTGAFTVEGSSPFFVDSEPLPVVVADFNGDGRADAAVANADSTNVSILLGAVPQSITFDAIPTQIFAAGSLALTASASSGQSVQYVSNSTGFCMVSGALVTFVAAGTCSITASQPGNTEYAAATPVTVTFTIDPAFGDVSDSGPSADESATFVAAIDDMLSNAITSGCMTSPFDYCPGLDVTRGQMAVFIVRAIYGSNNFTAVRLNFFDGE